MRIFDLHCDTLYECAVKNKSIYNGELEINIEKGEKTAKHWIQCFAVWIPDEIRGEQTFELFEKCCDIFEKSDIKKIKVPEDLNASGAILTVEGGSVIGGSLEKLEKLYGFGVRMMTLTWNGENELGFGSGSIDASGLKDFGRSAVKKMNDLNMVVDVSHLSNKGFYDVAEIAEKPFVASHSNLRSVTDVPRNLTDEQFKIIRDCDGIVGLNFHKYFLEENGNPTEEDILRHVDRFMELGGEKTLCIGSDFDGAEMPYFIKDITSLPKLYELFLSHGYPEAVLEDIFFNNAKSFFERTI